MILPRRLLFVLLCLSPAIHAAEEKKATAGQPTTQLQKFSYSVGAQVANSILSQGVKIDPDAFALAVHDAVNGGKFRLSVDEMKQAMETEKQAAQEKAKALADKNSKDGEAFRAEYKKKDGVKALPSGILYRVIKEGKGQPPKLSDEVAANYTGRFIDGREFDSSAKNGGPVSFELGKVIKGWQEALQLMGEGAKWEFVIPPELAYGEKGAGGGVIGPNETLVFEVELVAVKPAANTK